MRGHTASLHTQTDETAGGSSDSGSGSQSGGIEFRDFTGLTQKSQRDDALPPDEQRRLLKVSDRTNEALVKKQKEKRDAITKLKNGQQTLEQFRKSEYGQEAQYKTHPIVSKFAGADPEMIHSEDNAEAKKDIENEYRLKHQLRYQPTREFNPKPKPI